MSSLEATLRRLDGAAHVQTLRENGIPQHAIRRALQAGRVIRVRPGIYAVATAHDDVVRAARVGGRLAGASAAAFHGLWTEPRHPLVVEVGGGASHLRDPDDATRTLGGARDDVRVLWANERRPLASSIGVTPLRETLRQVVLTSRPEFAVATLDSALRRSPLMPFDVAEMASTLPADLARLVAHVDGKPESGTESVVRYALSSHGVEAVPQVRVPFTELDRIDLLVGDRLAIECQSQEHHGSAESRLRDLRRYSDLQALGFIVIEVDYRQAFGDLEAVIASILSYVDRGLHLSSSHWPRPF
jgi:very-short-patch-repair endonuclease